jgi:hypothetical protein
MASTKVLTRGDLFPRSQPSSRIFRPATLASHLPYSRAVEGGPREPIHALFWAYQSWRCEYHTQPDGAKRVTLLHEGKALLVYVARDPEEAREIAGFWRELVGTEDWEDAELVDERRWTTDRRREERRGRRKDDAGG